MSDNTGPDKSNVIGMRRVVRLTPVVTYQWYKTLKDKGIVQQEDLLDFVTFIAIPQQVLANQIKFLAIITVINTLALIILALKFLG